MLLLCYYPQDGPWDSQCLLHFLHHGYSQLWPYCQNCCTSAPTTQWSGQNTHWLWNGRQPVLVCTGRYELTLEKAINIKGSSDWLLLQSKKSCCNARCASDTGRPSVCQAIASRFGRNHGIGWPYTETCYSEKYDLYEIEKYRSQATASIGGWSPGLLCDPPSIHSCKPIIQSFTAAQSIIHTILWSCTFSCICTLNHLGQHPSWQKS